MEGLFLHNIIEELINGAAFYLLSELLSYITAVYHIS